MRDVLPVDSKAQSWCGISTAWREGQKSVSGEGAGTCRVSEVMWGTVWTENGKEVDWGGEAMQEFYIVMNWELVGGVGYTARGMAGLIQWRSHLLLRDGEGIVSG